MSEVYISDIVAWCKISFEGSNANPLYFAHNLYLDGELVTKLTIPDSVTSICWSAFNLCENLNAVYYGGTAEEWSKINIEDDNEDLTDATIYCFSEDYPFDDEDDGNYWHYNDNGEPEIWVKRVD